VCDVLQLSSGRSTEREAGGGPLLHVTRGVVRVVERVQPAAAGGSTEREASGGGGPLLHMSRVRGLCVGGFTER